MSTRVKELVNLNTEKLIDRLLSGELSIEDKEVKLALLVKILSELEEIKQLLVNLY